jgi:hypothetical protein
VQAAPLALIGQDGELQKVLEGVKLNRKQVWHLYGFFNFAKRAPFNTAVRLCQSRTPQLVV